MDLQKKTKKELIEIIEQAQGYLETLEEEYRLSRVNEQALASLHKLVKQKGVRQKDILEFALEEAVKITRSEVGYLHFFSEEKDSLELYLWSREVHRRCTAEPVAHYPLEHAGIWADCIRTGKPALHNDYERIADRKGLPEGHFPVKRHLSLPIIDDDKVIGVLGVGNKESDYDDFDIQKLSLFVDEMWNIVREKKESNLISMLMNSAAEGICGLDRNGICIFCNRAAVELLGYREEGDLVGNRLHDLVHHTHASGKHYAHTDCPSFLSLSSGNPYHSDFEMFYRQDGSSFPVEYWAHPLMRDEEVMGAVVSFIDITEKKKTEDYLKKSRLQFESLYQLLLMDDFDEKEISNYALDRAVMLTGSTLGFVGLLDEAEKVFTQCASSAGVMRECGVIDSPVHFDIPDAGLWGDAVRERRPVVVNDYKAPHLSKKGLPEGHVELSRLMCIPITDAGRVVSVFAVANRESDYEKDDLEQLRLLGKTMWTIIKRRQSEMSTRRSLKEKEVLLSEVHHRVKNNMQVISSLMSLQAGQVRGKETSDVLRKSQGRIKSMALVHEQLYQTSDFSRIDVRTYVTRLLDSIGKTFDADRKNVRHTIDIMVSLELDTLIPCGLILTELITNSFKHGFAEGQGGEIVIHMRYLDDHTVKLVYGDSGPGVPDALDIRTTGGLGLKLVDTLITQLEGTLEIESGEGMAFHVTFPVKAKTGGQ